VEVLAWSSDGQSYFVAKHVGQGGTRRVEDRLVDSVTGKTLVSLELPEPSQVSFGAFTPDGTRLIHSTVNERSVCVWDLRALRLHLAELDLDWDAPAYPPGPDAASRYATLPLKIHVDGTAPAKTP